MERATSALASDHLFAATKKHALFDLTPLDQKTEEIDEKCHRCYQNTSRLAMGKSPKDRHELYSKHVAVNPQVHSEELIIGLTVGLLTEDHLEDANRVHEYYQDIVTISKDNLVCFGSFVNILIVERINKMSHHVLKRIFWIANQLFKAGAIPAEAMCSNLVRQTAKSDLSDRNLLMADNLINLLVDNRNWLVKSTQFMVPTVIYNLMRLINDHSGPIHRSLRQKEVSFVIGLIREKFDLVIGIGRDFLRQLQYLHSTKIQEFQELYQDIYHNDPKLLHPTFEGPQQLLTTRTPRRLFQTCLSYDMERKISYIATQVKFGNQKRYQEWFAKQHFTGHDTNSLLRCDIIRYICTIIHPSNEVLCSDIIPRWAIIGWLLTTAVHVVQSCRLALFFDWLAYDPRTDNIMNIEPGILIMAHSVRSHPQVTSNLLDFLCRAPFMFPPRISNQIRSGIKKSLQQCLEKRVIQSLAPIFLNPKFDPTLKQLVEESFTEYSQPENEANVSPSQRVQQAVITPGASAANPIVITASASPFPITTTAAKTSAKTNNNQHNTEVIVLDDSPTSGVPPTPTAISATPKPPTSLVEIKEAAQDFNHNASTNVTHDKPEPEAKRLKSNQRPPVIKMWGKTEGDSEVYSIEPVEVDEKSMTKSKRTPPIKIDLPTLEEPVKYSYSTDHDEARSDASKLRQNDQNNIEVKSFEGMSPFSDIMHNDMITLGVDDNGSSSSKVIYPFMAIKTETCRVAKHLIGTFEDTLDEFQGPECSTEDKCSLMSKLLANLSEKHSQLSNKDTNDLIKYLANRIVYTISEDFTTHILASPTHDLNELERSLSKPLFTLCREAFQDVNPNPLLMKMLVTLTKLYRATSFLVLYFMRARYCLSQTASCQHYISFCEASGREPDDALQDDLDMMHTYDSEMVCFVLPTIFSEYVLSKRFSITNNVKLIHRTVSSLDPIGLQELMCFCLTGTCKVISRENPQSVIEASLEWESWEQYCFWKLLSAQSVPLENYTSMMANLDAKCHPEAVSSIMLNLQKCEAPSTTILHHLINAHSKQNEQFVTAVIRHWAIRTDIQELAQKLVSLIEARSASSSQVKKKGQNRANNKSPSLSTNDEKILRILDYIRLKAPKNKLFTQKELFDGLDDIESVCNEDQRKRFEQMFAFRKLGTKRKKIDKDATS